MSEEVADAPPPAPEPSPAPEVTREHQIVWQWFNEHIANSPVSRVTEAVNHLMARLPDLISALETKG